MTPGTLVANRYLIEEQADRGAFADVFRARDKLTQALVALKWLFAGSPQRELVAMRGMETPGLVRLLDEGTHEDRPFLVTPWIDGYPFPGGGYASLTWVALRPLAIELLQIVARMHAHGGLHLDLKPENVFVAQGRVQVLDLGLAGGQALGAASTDEFADRSVYTAPELRTGVTDPRTDLFSIGVMLTESLAGPAPPEIRPIIESMCARDPADRPTDAWAVLHALGVAPPQAPRLTAGGRVSAAALRPIFTQVGLFDRERVVERLLAETDGDPAAVHARLTRWLRLGVATLEADGSRIRIPPRWSDAIAEADPLKRAQDALRDGRMDDARRWVRRGLLTHPQSEAAFVRIGGLAAIDTFRAAHIKEALYWAGRSRTPCPFLERLLQVALLGRVGDETVRARAALDALPTTDDLELAAIAFALRMHLANGAGAEAMQTELAQMPQALISHLETESRVLSWRGHIAYRRGQYAESAALQTESSRRSAAPCRTLSAMLNAVAALIEMGNFDQAMRLAERAERTARTIRHDFFALRACWVWREAAWRAGKPLRPDPFLVERAAGFGPAWQVALLALTEASGAWRLGERVQAHALAICAEQHFEQLTQSRGGLQLAQALRQASAPVPETDNALVALTVEQAWLDLDWQILGVIASTPPGRKWHAVAAERAQAAPDPDRRREVFTPREVIDGFWAPACQFAAFR